MGNYSEEFRGKKCTKSRMFRTFSVEFSWVIVRKNTAEQKCIFVEFSWVIMRKISADFNFPRKKMYGKLACGSVGSRLFFEVLTHTYVPPKSFLLISFVPVKKEGFSRI
jgi:hypothetical protein